MKASSRLAAPRAATSAAGAPVASTRPACISEMRSQRAASFMKWVETKIVTPWLRERSISSSQKSSRATGSTPEVGSSRISSSGSCSDRDGERQPLANAERQARRNCVEIGRPGRSADESAMRARAFRAAGGTAARAARGSAARSAPYRARRTATCSRRGGALRVGGVDRLAEQQGLSFGRRQQAGQHLHRRGLAAAVGPEKAEDLAALDLEADVVDGGEVAEARGSGRGPRSTGAARTGGRGGMTAGAGGRGGAPPAAGR